jgi:hypothetical protein
MLMPDKHIRLSESFYGLGSFLLELLISPKTIDELWGLFSNAVKNKDYPSSHSFEHLVLAVNFLYAIRAVDLQSNGALKKCD